MKTHKNRTSFKQNAFTGVAFWQLMVFILLLCFAWGNELLDLPSIVFGTEHTSVDYYRLSFLSAGIITAAIVAVGQTYEKQKAVARNLVGSCPYCHRVQTADKAWQNVHNYFVENYLLDVDNGLCPDCSEMVNSVNLRQAKSSLARNDQPPVTPNSA